MKSIHSLAAIIALSFLAMPIVVAQETETPTTKPGASPSDVPEAVPTSPSENAEPRPVESAGNESPAPTPSEKATRKAGKSPASSPAKTSPAASPAKKPAQKGSVEAQLKAIEDTYEAAIQNHNLAAIEAFTADDFVLTNSKGKVLNHRAAFAELKKDTDTYTSTKNSDMGVRQAANNVAIVTGTSREIGKDKAGKPFDRTYRWTDTWVDRNGKWLIVASQAMLVGK